MPKMMLAEAGRLMMRRLWIQLWSLRRARRDVTLAQPANWRAGEDDDSDLDEAEVGGAVEMNGHGGNDVSDMGFIVVVSCGDGILVSTQSSEKEGATNRCNEQEHSFSSAIWADFRAQR